MWLQAIQNEHCKRDAVAKFTAVTNKNRPLSSSRNFIKMGFSSPQQMLPKLPLKYGCPVSLGPFPKFKVENLDLLLLRFSEATA